MFHYILIKHLKQFVIVKTYHAIYSFFPEFILKFSNILEIYLIRWITVRLKNISVRFSITT